MYLLDTSALSELVKRRPNERFIGRLRQTDPAALCTAVVCVMELRYGAWLRPDREAFWERIAADILSRVRIMEFGQREALVAGEMLAYLRRAGRPVGLEDVLIAATARSYGYTVITHNLRHFERLPEVKVEDWLS